MKRSLFTRFALAAAVATAAATALTSTNAVAAPPLRSVSPTAASAGALLAVDAVSHKDVWAAGYQQPQVGTSLPMAEHWNGTKWQRTRTPLPGGQPYGTLQSIAVVADNDVWGVGYSSAVNQGASQTLAEHWNGKRWSVVPTAEPPGSSWSGLQSVTAVSADDVWAVGWYFGGSGVTGTVIEHWDGTQWSVVPSQDPAGAYNPALQGVTAVSANNVWAVGFYYDSVGAGTTMTEHWDGTSWQLVDSPNEPNSPDTELHAVTSFGKKNVWATGFAATSSGTSFVPVAAHWDGTSWTLTQAAVPGGTQNAYLYGISGTSGKDIWATGYYLSAGNYLTLAEHWDGTSWQIVSTPNVPNGSNYLHGVDAISKNQVWAAGIAFTNQDQAFTERYDGSSWSMVPAK